jgi:hypothetical protein
MSELTGPETECSIDGCERPAVVTPRAASAEPVTSEPPAGELVPLCAVHAEQATSAS